VEKNKDQIEAIHPSIEAKLRSERLSHQETLKELQTAYDNIRTLMDIVGGKYSKKMLCLWSRLLSRSLPRSSSPDKRKMSIESF
jgi:hypothetical protein